MSRCSGQCCKKFNLPFSPIQLEHFKRQLALGKDEVIYERRPRYTHQRGQTHVSSYDIEHSHIDFIVDMLEFVRMDYQPSQDGDARGHSTRKPHALDDRIYHYTCRHFDGKNCTVYDVRPPMCRNFPDHGSCSYRGCTWKNPRSMDVDVDLKMKVDKCHEELQELKSTMVQPDEVIHIKEDEKAVLPEATVSL